MAEEVPADEELFYHQKGAEFLGISG